MESSNQILSACCTAIGKAMHPNAVSTRGIGSKTVGAMLFPDLLAEAAQKKLLDCLDDDRPHKLTFDQVMFILRKAKECGYHEGMALICGDIGYTMGQPIKSADVVAELTLQILEGQKQTQAQIERLLALQPSLKVNS